MMQNRQAGAASGNEPVQVVDLSLALSAAGEEGEGKHRLTNVKRALSVALPGQGCMATAL